MKTKVKKVPKMGRGVFAAQDFKKGDIIEISPVVIIPRKQNIECIGQTILCTYVFGWTAGKTAIALGNGSLFNHKKKPNVSYIQHYRSKTIRFKAKNNIRKGTQLFIDYGYTQRRARKWYAKNKVK